MEHYKSWAGLNKQLKETLCESLKGKITYFLTRYHDVHNSYGRAAILFDGKELVNFAWIEMYYQERDISAAHEENHEASYEDIRVAMKSNWDSNCTYNEMDFLDAVLRFRSMAIQDALESEDYIIKILAIMDKRVGQRTLLRIYADKKYEMYPDWVRQFYELRLSKIDHKVMCELPNNE